MLPLSYENAQYHQNRRQKVVNRGLYVCMQGGVDILKFDKLS